MLALIDFFFNFREKYFFFIFCSLLVTNICSTDVISFSFKYNYVWKFQIIHEYFTSVFKSNSKGLVSFIYAICILSFSTHSRIFLSSEYFHYKLFVNVYCCNWCQAGVLPNGLPPSNLIYPIPCSGTSCVIICGI